MSKTHLNFLTTTSRFLGKDAKKRQIQLPLTNVQNFWRSLPIFGKITA